MHLPSHIQNPIHLRNLVYKIDKLVPVFYLKCKFNHCAFIMSSIRLYRTDIYIYRRYEGTQACKDSGLINSLNIHSCLGCNFTVMTPFNFYPSFIIYCKLFQIITFPSMNGNPLTPCYKSYNPVTRNRHAAFPDVIQHVI